MADTPPRRRRPPAGQARPAADMPQGAQEASSAQETQQPSPPPPPTAPGKGSPVLQKKLERMIVALGFPFAAAGDMHCARIFAQRGPVVAEAWATLAAESPAVKEALEAMLKGGAWTGAVGATVGLLVPVAAHHGAPIPNPARVLFGIPPDESPHQPQPAPQSPVTPPRNGQTPNGNGVPGPAAYSFAPPAPGERGADPTDPNTYPGN